MLLGYTLCLRVPAMYIILINISFPEIIILIRNPLKFSAQRAPQMEPSPNLEIKLSLDKSPLRVVLSSTPSSGLVLPDVSINFWVMCVASVSRAEGNSPQDPFDFVNTNCENKINGIYNDWMVVWVISTNN